MRRVFGKIEYENLEVRIDDDAEEGQERIQLVDLGLADMPERVVLSLRGREAWRLVHLLLRALQDEPPWES